MTPDKGVDVYDNSKYNIDKKELVFSPPFETGGLNIRLSTSVLIWSLSIIPKSISSD